MVRQAAGVKLDHVPYRGAGQAINDLVAGHVRVAFLGPTALLPHYKAGTVKLLAQTGETRSRSMPDIPTLREIRICRHIAGVVVRRIRAAWHAGRSDRTAQRRDEKSAGRSSDAGQLPEKRDRAGRQQPQELARAARADFDKYAPG